MRNIVNCGFVLGCLVWVGGCDSGKGEYGPVEKGVKVADDPHEHHDEHGPHGGHLIEFGKHESHAELVFDGKSNKLTVYVFGHDLDEANPIAQKELTLHLMIDGKETPFQLKAAPLEGEPQGKSSRFELSGHEQIAEHIHDAEDLKGHLKIKIGDKTYEGEITHDHDHNHESGHKDDDDHK